MKVSARAAHSGVLHQPEGAAHPVRPNTPVLPYGSPSRLATFLDPSSRILLGDRISVAAKTYIAPFAGLDATNGSITVGQGSAVLDNAVILANPSNASGTPGVSIGDLTVIQYGARIEGPTRIGAAEGAARPTSIGPNAVVRDSTIASGAIVGAGAVVTGVTVPAGIRVLPGAVISSQAEASDPSLGKVVAASTADVTAVRTLLSDSTALASGYATLYQGQSASGVAGSAEANTTVAGLFNGDLARVRGTSAQPVTSFAPRAFRPKFLTRKGKPISAGFANFPARVIGVVRFNQRPSAVAARVDKNVSIRADENQQIRLGAVDHLGAGSTIRTTRTGPLIVGRGLRTGQGSVIVGGPNAVLGDNVQVGTRAVVENSKLGSGTVIGEGAVIENSTLADGTVIPAGAVIVNNVRL